MSSSFFNTMPFSMSMCFSIDLGSSFVHPSLGPFSSWLKLVYPNFQYQDDNVSNLW
jgi:hypothetical protein